MLFAFFTVIVQVAIKDPSTDVAVMMAKPSAMPFTLPSSTKTTLGHDCRRQHFLLTHYQFQRTLIKRQSTYRNYDSYSA